MNAPTTKTSTEVSAAPAESHAQMHAEHRHWTSESIFWHDELGIWQTTLHKVLSQQKSAALEAALRETQTHAAAIRLRQQELMRHEQVLADFEQGGSGEILIALAAAHRDEAAAHARMSVLHQRIKHDVEAALSRAQVKLTVSQGRDLADPAS